MRNRILQIRFKRNLYQLSLRNVVLMVKRNNKNILKRAWQRSGAINTI